MSAATLVEKVAGLMAEITDQVAELATAEGWQRTLTWPAARNLTTGWSRLGRLLGFRARTCPGGPAAEVSGWWVARCGRPASRMADAPRDTDR
ncbi:hypothetical protein ABN034_12435 [Actinopolymorpha sp. B11F2]|uniref:hypothetical protein n=1 Tax=Actinopolymorpha sp. B11F2 TaxID=3160862 RepID=UPI0032E4313B